jgi:hypothetical protein
LSTISNTTISSDAESNSIVNLTRWITCVCVCVCVCVRVCVCVLFFDAGVGGGGENITRICSINLSYDRLHRSDAQLAADESMVHVICFCFCVLNR